MDQIIRREERRQLLRFVVALILFVCALHVLCSTDNQMALARAEGLQIERAAIALVPVMPPSERSSNS